MTDAASRPTSFSPGRVIVSVLLPLAIGLGLFYLTMNPAWGEFSAMIELMTLTTALSLIVTFAAYRLGWIHRSPRLHPGSTGQTQRERPARRHLHRPDPPARWRPTSVSSRD